MTETPPKLLAQRSQFQWGRKLFHIFNGLTGLWLYVYSGLSWKTVTVILIALLSLSVTLEMLRFAFPQFNAHFTRRLSGILRERERHKINSATWYMAAILVVFCVFPLHIAALSLFYVAVGDTVASTVGSFWGTHRINEHASWEGSVSGFFSCLGGSYLLAYFALPNLTLAGWSFFIFAFGGSLAASASESIIKKIDDNLVVPITSAITLWSLEKILT